MPLQEIQTSKGVERMKTDEEICGNCGYTEIVHTKKGLDKIGFYDYEYAWNIMRVCKKFTPKEVGK